MGNFISSCFAVHAKHLKPLPKFCSPFLFITAITIFQAVASGALPGNVHENAGQAINVRGVVVSIADNMPLPGVNVIEKGTQNGTVTGADGSYSIMVSSPGAILQFVYMGYLTQDVNVDGKSVIDMVMHEDTKMIDELVVVGYGTMKRSDLTGSIVSVSEDKLRATIASNIDQAMQGRLAGVQITQNSGQPGGAASIRIRGASSITGSSEPLYVIDGIPFQGEGAQFSGFDWSGGANGQNRVNPLSTINPNDIVEIHVLKDASASAIYGSQAANGVILITTRRGRAGESRISYNTYYALQTLPRKLELMDLRQFADYQLQIHTELGATPNERHLDPSLLGHGTDWQDEIFRQAWVSSHQFSVSGGSDRSAYAIMGGYFNQDGIIIGSGMQRFSGRINIDNQVNKWIKAGGSISYTRANEQITLNDGGDGVIMNALLMQPDVPVKTFEGTYGGPANTYSGVTYNPVAEALLRNNELTRERTMANTYMEADLFKGIVFRSEAGFDNSNSINIAFHPTYEFGAIKNTLNKMRQREENNFFWLWKNYVTYNFTFFDKHSLSAMVGNEAQKSDWQGIVITKEDFTTNEIRVLSQGENTTTRSDGWKDGSAMLSYYSRLVYNYSDKYLLTMTMRADGSSKFGPKNKWGYFPSGSFAWRISQEDFMSSMEKVSNLKLRLGYGMVGNQGIGTYLYGSSMHMISSGFGSAYRMERISNPDLKWEASEQYNIGLDLALFSSRVEFTADIYKKNTKNMLLQLSVPNYLGGSGWQDIAAPYVNIGKMENKGIDVTLVTRNILKSRFTWETDITLSHNKNKVLELNDEASILWGNLYWYSRFQTATMTTAGYPMGVFYGYETDGLFHNADEIYAHAVQIQNPDSTNKVNLASFTSGVWIGDIRFKDLLIDSVINEKDQKVIGDPNPKFTFGLGNSFTYGPFDLTIRIYGSYGAEILNFSRSLTEGLNNIYANQAASVHNRARYALVDPEGSEFDPSNVYLANPGTDIPRFATNENNGNNRMSDRFIEDGSFIRIQNISFGYTIPSHVSQRVKMNRLKVYVNIQNLYTFTKYSGYDPEIGAFNQDPKIQNVDMGRYPTPRMFTFGLNADF